MPERRKVRISMADPELTGPLRKMPERGASRLYGLGA
jgi:hypothetical protein